MEDRPIRLSDSVDRKIETKLTAGLDHQYEKVQKMHEEMMAVFQKEESRRREREVSAEHRIEAHSAMMRDLQEQEARERNERSKLQTRLIGLVIAMLGSGGGAIAWSNAQYPTREEQTKEVAAPIVETVRTKTKDVESRVSTLERKVEILKNIALDIQVQVSEDGEYTRKLIKAANPRLKSKDIVEPESVREARKKAKMIKESASRRKEDTRSIVDPFAGVYSEDDGQ